MTEFKIFDFEDLFKISFGDKIKDIPEEQKNILECFFNSGIFQGQLRENKNQRIKNIVALAINTLKYYAFDDNGEKARMTLLE